jgi:diaminopimelate decarboxylase
VTGFERRHGLLECEGVSLEALARQYGTPLYVYSARVIADDFDAYARAFAAVPHRICYALKANSSGAILRLLAARGAGADIVSGGELQAALRAGFPPERVVFSGVGKTDAEIGLGLAHAIGEWNAEGEDEIERLAAAASAAGSRARLTLRVNPDIDPRSHPYISTGLHENKFGVEIGQALGILERASRLPGVTVTGVQCHIGSQVTDLEALEEAARALAGLSRELLDRGFALETIDIGGGLGVAYEGGAAPTPAELAARVLPSVAPLGLRLLVEPGRSLVARAGILLTRVLSAKQNGRKRFLVVDAGMNDLLRPSLYDAYHRIEPVRERGTAARVVDVVGPVCETGDFLARARSLPEVPPGDLLAVRDAGAYAFSMASNYNLRPRPAEVLVESGRARLVRRRESFEDLVRTEIEAG